MNEAGMDRRYILSEREEAYQCHIRFLFLYAIETGQGTLIKLLLEKGADVNEACPSGNKPVLYALENDRHDIVHQLLLCGEINLQRDEWSKLLLYASGKGHRTILELLAGDRSHFDDEDDHGRTPLSYAAENGHCSTVQVLAEKGARVNFADDLGRTPLAYAADKGHKVVIQELINYGANKTTLDELKPTPLECAQGKGYGEDILELLRE
ncbi:ankyrin repeat-containing domain protein [Apiospora kogelbergensis]|uniref:Ankyrin repeat-containing domain protein n=1 Tax=Apiospora kogelbergensis TaxID=1337665 RepID=A0AAW0REM8_9PEZI